MGRHSENISQMCELLLQHANTEFNVHMAVAVKGHVDYTSMMVKHILISGIEGSEIRKDVLGMPELDAKSDKDIVKFVEEKEIARNALQTTLSTNAVSSYNKSRKAGDASADIASKKKLSMRGKCGTCCAEISLYKQYRGGRLNKEAFKVCINCHKKENNRYQEPKVKKEDISETTAILSFINALEVSDSEHPSEISTGGIDVACSEIPQNDTDGTPTLTVKVCVSSRAHSKFGRCAPDAEAKSVNEQAVMSDTLGQCIMGTDMLRKLNCPKSMLIKSKESHHIYDHRSAGRAFVKLESGG